MRPGPHGVVKREALDGVKEGPPEGIVADRDAVPDLVPPWVGVACDRLGRAAATIYWLIAGTLVNIMIASILVGLLAG